MTIRENKITFEDGRLSATIKIDESFQVEWFGDDCGGSFIANTIGELIDELPFLITTEQFSILREVLGFND